MQRALAPTLLTLAFSTLQLCESLSVTTSSQILGHLDLRRPDYTLRFRTGLWLNTQNPDVTSVAADSSRCLRLRGGLAGPGTSGIPSPGNLGFGTWQVPTSGLGIPIAGLATLVAAGQIMPMVSKGTSHWSKTTRTRVRDTYLYFGGSCMTWVLSGLLAWKTGMVPNHPLTVLAIFCATTYAFVQVQRLDYASARARKAGWFFGAVGLKGLVLSTIIRQLAHHNQIHLIIQALALTAAEAVGMAAVVAAAPSTNFLLLAGPLAAGLSLLLGANLINLLFGRGRSVLHVAEAYFGALLFSGYLLFDTAKMVKAAQRPVGGGDREFDPIRQALQLYLDAVNLFFYILRILMDQEARSSSPSDSSSQRHQAYRSPPLRNARRSTVYDLH